MIQQTYREHVCETAAVDEAPAQAGRLFTAIWKASLAHLSGIAAGIKSGFDICAEGAEQSTIPTYLHR